MPPEFPSPAGRFLLLTTKVRNLALLSKDYHVFFLDDANLESFYVDGGVSIGWGKEKDKRHYDDNNDNRDVHDSECRKTNSFDIGLRPGMLIDLSDNVALELNLGFLGYTHSEITGDTHNSNYENAEYTSTSNGFGFCGNGGNVNFGVIWKF